MESTSSPGLPSLCLGTVQIGQPYGIANPGRMPSVDCARALLDAAWAGGIRRFDTARAYGDAEMRIGAWAAARGVEPAIVTKFPPLEGADGPALIEAALDASLAALGVARVEGLLAHRAADLRLPGVAQHLRDLVSQGRVGAFGASAYSGVELEEIVAIDGLGLVQLPFSVVDRRFATIVLRLAGAGIRVQARSVFLQGALLMEPDALPPHLTGLRPVVRGLRALARRAETTPLALALGYALGKRGLDSVVFGAYTRDQLAACLAASATGPLDAETLGALDDLADGLPPEVVDPSRWPR